MSPGIRLLHVDDDESLRSITAEFLSRELAAVEIESVSSADEGLSMLEARSFDCVLSDYDMPGVSGVEFLTEVRKQDTELPFILFTGKGSEEIASEAITAGVTDYLQKSTGTSQYTVLANRIQNAVDQHRDRRSLQESQERLSLLIEQSPIGIIEWDENFNFSRVNNAAEEILGISEADVIGEPWNRIVPGDTRPSVDAIVGDLLENVGGGHSINRNIRGDGTEIICEWHNQVVTDDRGEVITIVSQFQDITERIEQQQAIQERVKELTAIRDTVTYVEQDDLSEDALIQRLANRLPESFQFPTRTFVKLGYGDLLAVTDGFDETYPTICAETTTAAGKLLTLTIAVESAADEEDPFLSEEQDLIETLVGFLHEHFSQEERFAQLTEARTKFETILSHSSDYVLIVDEQGTITYASQSIESVMGYQPAAVIGTNAFEYVHEEDIELAVSAFSEAVSQDEEVSIEYRAIRSDGEPIWIGARGRDYLDEEHIDGILVNVRDISARKERERELTQAKMQLEAAVEAGSVGTWQWLVQEDDFWVDPLFAETFGVDPAQAREGAELSLFFSSIHDDDRERVRLAIETALDDCDDYSIEYRVWNTADELRWVHARGRVECDDAGEPVQFPGTLIDITEQKMYEYELNKRSSHLEHLHQATNDLYAAYSTPECHQIAIDAAVEILGFDWCTITAPAPDSELFEIIAVSENTPLDVGDRPFRTDEGLAGKVYQSKEPDISNTASEVSEGKPVSDAIQSGLTIPIGDWGVFQAVSTERDAFDEVDLRHAELLISAMRTAIERIEHESELQRRNERLNEFTSVVSHDLRNPLTVAAGRIELAMVETSSEHLDAAAKALARMEQLIDDLLSLAERGDRVGERAIVDLASVCQDAWDTIDTNEVLLSIEVDQTIVADRTRLQQALENLLGNAIEHGETVSMITIGSLEDGWYLEDDGVGLPEDSVERLFDAGFSTSTEGTGFGLAIVREIIDAHGWSIKATDGGTGGARFEVTGVDFVSDSAH